MQPGISNRAPSERRVHVALTTSTIYKMRSLHKSRVRRHCQFREQQGRQSFAKPLTEGQGRHASVHLPGEQRAAQRRTVHLLVRLKNPQCHHQEQIRQRLSVSFEPLYDLAEKEPSCQESQSLRMVQENSR